MRIPTPSPALRAGALALAAAGALAFGPADARAQATLRWKFQKGETLNYAMNQSTNIALSNPNKQNIKSAMNQRIDTTWRVADVQGETAEIVQTIDRIRTSMEQPNGKTEYDSRDGKLPEGPVGQLLGPILGALVGAEIAFKMDGRGEVTDVRLPEKVLEAVKNLPNRGAGGGGMFTEEGLKKMVTQSTLTLPEEAVAKGASWSKAVKLPTPPIGTMDLENTYTYEGAEQKDGTPVERIAIAVKTTLEPAEGTPFQVDVRSQDAQGNFLFDNTKGRLNGSSLTQKMELVIKVMDQEITQSNETTATMTLGQPEE